MKIGLYISELLFRHDKVVFPGLGTFSTIYEPAKFIPEKRIVKPPSKIATFICEHNADDMLLIAHVAQKERKSQQEVVDYLKKFIKESEHALNAGERIILEKVGVFRKDTAGGLVFYPDQKVNYAAIGNELSEIQTPDQKPSEIINVPQSNESKDDEAEEKSTDIKGFKEESIREKETAPPPIQKNHSEPKQTEHMAETEKNEGKEVKPLPPALKWTAIIMIPLLVILIIVFLNFNFFFGDNGLFSKSEPVTAEQPAKPKIPEVVEEPITEPTVEETYVPEPAPEPEPKPKPKPKPELSFDPYAEPPQPDPYRLVYFVVVGSFEDKNNADRLALELRKDGNQLASTLRMTPTGFHRTYSGFYYNLNEAKEEKNQLREELREIAWILHR